MTGLLTEWVLSGNGRARLVIAGDIDVESAPVLVQRGADVLADVEVHTLMIDVGDAIFIDSSGISALDELRVRAVGLSKRLMVLQAPEQVSESILGKTHSARSVEVAPPWLVTPAWAANFQQSVHREISA